MPLSTMDEISALVVIDLQKGILSVPTVHPMADVVANAARLAATFRRHGQTVVLVNVAGRAPGRTDAGTPTFSATPDFTDLIEELDAQSDDVRVTKHRWGAFYGTSLDQDLTDRGVTQVVLAGVATSAGVESTARCAAEYGYNVVLAIDAMSDRDLAVHTNSVERIFPRLGETATTEEIVTMMDDTYGVTRR